MSERFVTLEIAGMHCAACAQTIEKALRRVAGVAEANVNFATETARVTFGPSQIGIKQLVAAIEHNGGVLMLFRVEHRLIKCRQKRG